MPDRVGLNFTIKRTVVTQWLPSRQICDNGVQGYVLLSVKLHEVFDRGPRGVPHI